MIIPRSSPSAPTASSPCDWDTHAHLGAAWSSKSPDKVVLVIAYETSSSLDDYPHYIDLTGIQVSIDGEVTTYSATQATEKESRREGDPSVLYKSSENRVVIPMRAFQAMLASKDCRIRLQTSDGYKDYVFSVDRMPLGMRAARGSLKLFMTRVRSRLRAG